MDIRIVLIEDEPATARNLQHFLEKISPEITVQATLESVEDSVAWFQANPAGCDLIFMDIRLNDGLSFRIFEQVSIAQPVVFVTAYHEYALAAFKANGIDYLLKPFLEKDIAGSIAKYRQLTGQFRHAPAMETILKIAESIQTPSNFKQSFLVHFREKMIPLHTDSISWFYTKNEIVYLHTDDNRKFVVDFTMEILQQRLDPRQFFRANRQFIVNRNAIREIDFFFNSRLAVQTFLEPEEKIIISKARVPEFKAWMNI